MGHDRMDHTDGIAELRATLEEVNERLLDISMSILSEAVESGRTTRPVEEKQVSQARRAIERAIEALNRLNRD
jgi:non-canonical (house-cleaning) NTP pyrophosphatase